jgi:hypothetical protein
LSILLKNCFVNVYDEAGFVNNDKILKERISFWVIYAGSIILIEPKFFASGYQPDHVILAGKPGPVKIQSLYGILLSV